MQLELSLKTSIIVVDTYLNNKNAWMLKLVKNTSKIKACTLLLAIRKKIKKLNKINLSADNISENSSEKAKKQNN